MQFLLNLSISTCQYLVLSLFVMIDLHVRLHWHQSQHPYQNLTKHVLPLSPIPRTILSPSSAPSSPPLVQLAMPYFHAYVLVDS